MTEDSCLTSTRSFMTTIFSEILINVSQKKDERLAFFLKPVIKVVYNPFSNTFFMLVK
jgi:hypothetical protein